MQVADRLIEHFGLTVSGGPFAGLRLPAGARAEHIAPYLLGTYESELHSWLAEARHVPFATVLDVGAKFGYYALGLARWFPRARVVAWDTDPWARRVMREGARTNETGNLEVRGYLSPRAFGSFVHGASLVVSDCEGFERRLFGKVDPQALAGAWMIIETHEERAPGVTAFLRQRFEGSHTVEEATILPRTPSADLVRILGDEDAARAVSEARGEQTWLFFRPVYGLQEHGGLPA